MSDEVYSFLRSVEQLKDRRLEEDEARSRELEEKILQDKRERQARRAGEFVSVTQLHSSMLGWAWATRTHCCYLPRSCPPSSSNQLLRTSQIHLAAEVFSCQHTATILPSSL